MIIALLTDFGTQDYFVGAMKGVISSINANARIIDITHQIPPQNIAAAGFTLRACYRDFPKNTIFTAVVDPGVGSGRRAILVKADDYYFIAPDNGLLSFIFNESKTCRVFEITNDKFFNHPVSNTFHGRDIFAPAAARLSNQAEPSDFGEEIKDFMCFKETEPRKISNTQIEAAIIHIDRFGNLITNLKTREMPEEFSILVSDKRICKLRRYFAEAKKSELFMIMGSAGFLEVAAFQDSAAQLLQVKVGQKVLLEKI